MLSETQNHHHLKRYDFQNRVVEIVHRFFCCLIIYQINSLDLNKCRTFENEYWLVPPSKKWNSLIKQNHQLKHLLQIVLYLAVAKQNAYATNIYMMIKD